MTETPQQAAIKAIEWHKQQEERGESPWSCRLYDGEDNGRPGQRCWLIPGHQCDCMNEHRARWEANQPTEPTPTTKSRITFRDATGKELEVEAHTDRFLVVRSPPFDLDALRSLIEGTRRKGQAVILCGEPTDKAGQTRAYSMGCDHATKPPATALFVVDDPPDPSPYMIRNFHGGNWASLEATIKKQQETEARRQRGECRYTYPKPKRRRR